MIWFYLNPHKIFFPMPFYVQDVKRMNVTIRKVNQVIAVNADYGVFCKTE